MFLTANSEKRTKDNNPFVSYSVPGRRHPYALGRTRVFGIYCSSFRVLQLLGELLLVGVVFYVALSSLAPPIVEGLLDPVQLSPIIIALSIALVVCNCCMGLYTTRQSVHAPELIQRLGASLSIYVFLVAAFFLFSKLPIAIVGIVAGASALSFILLYLGRTFVQKYMGSEKLMKGVLILGNGQRAEQVFDILNGYSEGAYKLYRINEPDCAKNEAVAEKLLKFVESHDIREIVLAYTDRRQNLPMSVLINCRLSGISIRDPIEFVERESGLIHFDFLDLGWIVFADGFSSDKVGAFFKRMIDIVGCVAMLLFTFPIFIIAAIAIKFDKSSSGPVFYHQIRVGLNGRLFRVWKFRSMFTDAEAGGAAIWATENDARITLVGAVLRKYRIDELPQLFNVLKGEMSLVGPRPERPEFVSKLSDLHVLYSERHRVKPGLTGWAQMRFPYTATANDSIKKLQYDMYYVKNRNLLLDILILLQTVEVVFCGKGAR